MSKRTFVFDLEWAEVLKDYRPEVRHEVYDAIIEYAASGTLSEELKPLAAMAFSFIKRQMDYNRERYQSEIEKKREGGRRSAAARQGKPATDEVSSPDPDSIQDSATLPNILEDTSTHLNTLQHSSAESTDIDIVYDNDIVDDIDKYLTLPLGTGGDEEILKRQAYMDVFFGDPKSSEDFIRRWETDAGELREMCDTVLDEWTVFNEIHTSAEDARKHFVSAVRTRYEKKLRQKKPKSPRSGKCSGKIHTGTASAPPPKETDLERLDRQMKERDESFQEMKQKAVKPAEYIRSLGYDPAKVSMLQVLDAEWRADNPPTLPIKESKKN